MFYRPVPFVSAILAIWVIIFAPCACCVAEKLTSKDHCNSSGHSDDATSHIPDKCFGCPSCFLISPEQLIIKNISESNSDSSNFTDLILSNDSFLQSRRKLPLQNDSFLNQHQYITRKVTLSKLERGPPNGTQL